MKKTLTIIILCLAFILIYLLQMNFFNWFTIAGVKPNLFIILVLFIGLFAGRRLGTIFGIAFGFIIDGISSNMIGQTAVALGVIGFLGGYLEKTLSKDSKITVILMVMVSTIAAELFIYLYRGAMLDANIEMDLFIKKLIIETIYNGIITIILYPLLQKLGYKIEDIFKNQQIMTRYF